MRGVVLVAGLVLFGLPLLPGGATADAEPGDAGPRVLLPPTNGTFVVGLFGQGSGLSSDMPDGHERAVTHKTWDLNTTDCDRRLYADLDYRPTSATGGNASIDVPYVFDLGVTFNGTTQSRRILEPRERIFLGELPDDGDFIIRLLLRQGAVVAWDLTVYAHEALNGCDGPITVGSV